MVARQTGLRGTVSYAVLYRCGPAANRGVVQAEARAVLTRRCLRTGLASLDRLRNPTRDLTHHPVSYPVRTLTITRVTLIESRSSSQQRRYASAA